MAEHVGERAQDRPVLARIAGRERGAVRHLHAAFGVDVDRGFFRIGGARQDHIGAMGAAVAMGADIDDERARRDLDLVGAEQEQHVDAALRHVRGIQAALARHQAEIERADARRGAVQHGEAVPAVLERAEFDRRLGRQRRNRRAILARQRAGADENERTLGCFQRVGEFALGQAARGFPAPAPR